MIEKANYDFMVKVPYMVAKKANATQKKQPPSSARIKPMIRALISPTLKKQPDLSYPINPDILVLTLSKKG
ncbi:hypothetical protein FC17_GL000504 [Secundilactobacillus paracollinoides DSM 15502 = JCM 11969]|nr:hypothetical protein FC17_GL000504 [Secundilactobacillus paracollinoides DSM 15502 = JCM 11969]